MELKELLRKTRQDLADFIIKHDQNAESFYSFIFKEAPMTIGFNIEKVNKLIQSLIDNKLVYVLIQEFYSETKNHTYARRSLLVNFENKILISTYYSGSFEICYSYDIEENILNQYKNLIFNYCKKPKKPLKRGNIYILSVKGKGMKATINFVPFKIDNFKMSIQHNYTDDFLPKHYEIERRLNTLNDNGIVVLHGKPGTGKTYYLRYLCKIIKKKILYIPPAMVQWIVEPAFIDILTKHKNSVILIEDADNILRSRDINSDVQTVSSILNISDGMLKDVLKIQIVATFNTDLRNIDEAFLRKGRLICEHNFIELDRNKAQELSDYLGFDTVITSSMTLADIYNQNKKDLRVTNKPGLIGFK